ncbi:MAG TPA: efflux transporter outer membrane subunit [Steroidobacteraceae bacterium]|nr:efflux transporter outer membrane subunit [Steroidobacteraceae bacterium]
MRNAWPGASACGRAARPAALAASVALLSACAAGPDFKPPPPPSVVRYTAMAQPVQTRSAPGAFGASQRLKSGGRADHAWWRRFGSAKLDAMIGRALVSNATLTGARANLRRAAQTLAAQSGASRYPQVAAKAGAERQTINPALMGFPGSARTFNVYDVGADVGYNFDLFGRQRRALESLAAQVDYQRYAFRGARLTLAADIVTAAITEAQLRAQLGATRRILAAQSAQVTMTRRRIALGTSATLDLLSLQSQADQTRASLAPLRVRLAQTRHLLALLAGRAPADGALPQFRLTDFTLPADLPLRVPAVLTRRRPDVRAAEALLHAATANYDVAVADLYPQITLSASLGSEALTTAALFGPGSLIWNVAGQLAQPLFNAGLRPAARAAESSVDAAAADYRETVLQALRNVADVLRALDQDARGLRAQSAADGAAAASWRLVAQQYRLGSASYLQVLAAEQLAQQARIGLIGARAQRLADTAAFFVAMGED